jgi:hypothetical protein
LAELASSFELQNRVFVLELEDANLKAASCYQTGRPDNQEAVSQSQHVGWIMQTNPLA